MSSIHPSIHSFRDRRPAAARPAPPAGTGDEHRSDRAGAPLTARAHELAQRRSGTDEVLLLWYPEGERLELSVCDVETGAGIWLDVEPDSAIDAFYHPYAYVAWREDSDHLATAHTASVI